MEKIEERVGGRGDTLYGWQENKGKRREREMETEKETDSQRRLHEVRNGWIERRTETENQRGRQAER